MIDEGLFPFFYLTLTLTLTLFLFLFLLNQVCTLITRLWHLRTAGRAARGGKAYVST